MQVLLSIPVVPKDRFAPIAAIQQVVECPRKFNASFASHGTQITRRRARCPSQKRDSKTDPGFTGFTLVSWSELSQSLWVPRLVGRHCLDRP